MRIYLRPEIQKRLVFALKKAGSREIGGILMGEYLKEGEFQIIDLTIQKQSGSHAFFFRLVASAIAPLNRFFKRTGNNYQKFNYIGEWHSHPSFPLIPSSKDIQSMFDIVSDAEVGANFVILLIVRLNDAQFLEATATVFLPDQTYFQCEILKDCAI